VFKARNKLDGRFCAIKKIPLRPEDSEQEISREDKVYREVKGLARVNHHFIVRYYGSWVEELPHIEDHPSTEESHSMSNNALGFSPGPLKDISPPDFDDVSVSKPEQSRSASFPRIRFAESDDEEDDEDSGDASVDGDFTSKSGGTETTSPSAPRRGRASRPVVTARKLVDSTTGETTHDLGRAPRILYIQMEFVEKVSEVVTGLIPPS